MSKLPGNIIGRVERIGSATSRECIAMAKEIRIYREQVRALVEAYARAPNYKIPRSDRTIAEVINTIDGGE